MQHFLLTCTCCSSAGKHFYFDDNGKALKTLEEAVEEAMGMQRQTRSSGSGGDGSSGYSSGDSGSSDRGSHDSGSSDDSGSSGGGSSSGGSSSSDQSSSVSEESTDVSRDVSSEEVSESAEAAAERIAAERAALPETPAMTALTALICSVGVLLECLDGLLGQWFGCCGCLCMMCR